MSMQPDLFTIAPTRNCGACVHRNAVDERQERGGCAPAGDDRDADDAPCDWWFPLTQLRAPIYGRAK